MDSTSFWPTFQEAANQFLSLPLSEEQIQQFQTLYALLVEANKTINLTRITSLEDFCTRHLLDSLTLVPVLRELPADYSLADIGSGAGFPALPLAIVFPQARIVAVESVQKKARFISEAAEALNLGNIKVLPERSEDLGKNAVYREQFDVVTARAVSVLNVLAELCLPLVKANGLFLAMKTTTAIDTELLQAQKAIELLGGSVAETRDVTNPHLPNRCIVMIRKTAPTPSQYPRKAGAALKNPLS